MQPDILATIDPKDLGLELQAARKRSGLRQEDAAKIINVSRTTVTAIEKGERRISASELVQLALAYNCQISDFVRPRPKVGPVREQFRGPNRLLDQDREAIEPFIGQLVELARRYVELEELLQAPLPQKYPTPYESRGAKISRIAEGIALDERQRLGLGDGPLPPLGDLLERYVGLRIFYLEMPYKFSEIYLYDDALGGCLAVNRNHRAERSRWSLAHGYLHFLAHRFNTDVSYTTEEEHRRFDPSEQLAEAFAANFLMPASGLVRQYKDMMQVRNRFTPVDLVTLANLYGVSVQALTLRLEDLELLGAGTWEMLKERKFSPDELRSNLGLDSTLPEQRDVLPLRYRALAVAARAEDLITEGQFAHLLTTDLMQARTAAAAIAAQVPVALEQGHENRPHQGAKGA